MAAPCGQTLPHSSSFRLQVLRQRLDAVLAVAVSEGVYSGAGGVEAGEAGDALLGGGTADLEAVPEGGAVAGNGVDHRLHPTIADRVNDVRVLLAEQIGRAHV